MQRHRDELWLEWREDAESMWAEVFGVCPKTKKVYPGDTLIVFERGFGTWHSKTTKKEFKNSRSVKKWVEAIFDACDKQPNEFRNRHRFYDKLFFPKNKT